MILSLINIPKSALFSEDPPFLLAAPTGRAAKRMSEITGVAAKTIHRLLGPPVKIEIGLVKAFLIANFCVSS